MINLDITRRMPCPPDSVSACRSLVRQGWLLSTALMLFTTLHLATVNTASANLIGNVDEQWDPARVQAEAGARVSTRSVPPGALHVGVGQDYPTLQEATRAARSGDTIVVHAGIYREVLGTNTPQGGYLNKSITVQAASGTKPVISGADIYANWQAGQNGLWFTSFVSPFPQTGPGIEDQIDPRHPFAGNLEQVFVDNLPLTQVGTTTQVSGNSKRFFYDAAEQRIYIGSNPLGRKVEISVRNRATLLTAPGITVKGLHFTGFSPNHDNGLATVVIDRDNVTLEDVTVTNSAASGIMVKANNVVLNRVTARFNGALGMQATRSNGLRVQFSRIDQNNIESFDFENCGGGANCVLAGAKITQSSKITFRYSSFRGNNSTGLWCDLNCAEAVIVGNYVEGNQKHGIYYEVSNSGWIVSNVVSKQRRKRAAGIKISGSAKVTVHRNTLSDNYNQIIFSSDPRNEWPTPGSDINTLDIRGNIFAENKEPPSSADDQHILEPFNSTGTAIAERILYFNRNAYLLAENLQNNGKNRFRWSNDSFFSLPSDFALATNNRFARSSEVQLVSDPLALFVNVAEQDYRLTDGIAGFNYNGGIGIPGSAIGQSRLFASTVNQARYQDGFGALFVEETEQNVELAVEPISTPEFGGIVTVPIRLSGVLIEPLTILAFTQRRTATPGQDYYGKTEQLVFSPGESVQELGVSILDDSVRENSETVSIRIKVQSGGENVRIVRDRALLTILDNDG